MIIQTLGESLYNHYYNHYCNNTNWKSLVSGADLPKWNDVKPEIKAAWENAGHQTWYYVKDIIEHKYPKVRQALEELVGAESKEELEMMEHMMSEMEKNEDIEKSLKAIRVLLITRED